MISSTVAGSTPAPSRTWTWAWRRISTALRPDSQPLRLPIGVRTASTITGWAIGVLLGSRTRTDSKLRPGGTAQGRDRGRDGRAGAGAVRGHAPGRHGRRGRA